MSVAIIYPIIIGFLLGFMLKRARFCFTGTLRDIYLEHRFENIWIFFNDDICSSDYLFYAR